MTKPLALAYVRVSTDDQVANGASLAAQETALREEADKRGWDIEIIREEGKSGKNLNRPALQDALYRLDRKQAQFLLCVRLDRLSRSVADFASLVERARKKGWGLVLQSPNIDFTDPSGQFVANVLASAAQYERAIIGVRVREGMAQIKKDEGKHMGRPVDPAMLPTYRRILAMDAAGQSHNSIALLLAGEGVPTARGGAWAAATVRRVVKSEEIRSLV